MKTIKRYCKVFLCLILSACVGKNTTYAAEIKEYTIPKGWSMFISKDYIDEDNILTSDNINIASVTKGIITAKEIGETFCRVTKNNQKGIYKIKVVTPKEIRHIFTEPNNPQIGSDFIVTAITNNSVKKLRFIIKNSNYTKVINAEDRETIGESYKYKCRMNYGKPGKVKIEAEVLKDGKWHIEQENNIEITINDPKLNQLKIMLPSDKCIEYIKLKEGFKSNLSRDLIVKGIYDIGYGNRIYPEKPFYNDISRIEAKAMLIYKLNKGMYSKSLNEFLLKNNITASQNEFDALLSFTYNLGTSWMKKSGLRNVILDTKSVESITCGYVNSSNGLNLRISPDIKSKVIRVLRPNENVRIIENCEGDWYRIKTLDDKEGYCYKKFLSLFNKSSSFLKDINKQDFIKEFLLYHKAGGKCIRGLLNRRIEELQIFFNNDYNLDGYKNKNNFELPKCH